MSTLETVLVFAGIPSLVFAVVAAAVYLGSSSRSRRYRPGRPFDFTPVWFLSAPAAAAAGAPAGARRAVGAVAAERRGELTGGGTAAVEDEWPGADTSQREVTGGASDRW